MVTGSPGIVTGLTVCFLLILLLVYSSQVAGALHTVIPQEARLMEAPTRPMFHIRHKGKKTWRGLCRAFTRVSMSPLHTLQWPAQITGSQHRKEHQIRAVGDMSYSPLCRWERGGLKRVRSAQAPSVQGGRAGIEMRVSDSKSWVRDLSTLTRDEMKSPACVEMLEQTVGVRGEPRSCASWTPRSAGTLGRLTATAPTQKFPLAAWPAEQSLRPQR